MADNSISGLYRILPAYPVKPPQPADKERENEKGPPQQERPAEKRDDDEDDDKPVIDEYV